MAHTTLLEISCRGSYVLVENKKINFQLEWGQSIGDPSQMSALTLNTTK